MIDEEILLKMLKTHEVMWRFNFKTEQIHFSFKLDCSTYSYITRYNMVTLPEGLLHTYCILNESPLDAFAILYLIIIENKINEKKPLLV